MKKEMNRKQTLYQYPYEWLSALVLLIYFSPLLFFPNEARFVVYDNLDTNVVWYKTLAESGLMFANGNAILDFTLGGIPRDYFTSEWSVDKLLYLFFDAQTAFSINYILTHVLAFLGLYLLLKKYVTQEPVIYTLVSLAFALIPLRTTGGITVIGLPLLVYAFTNIFKNDNKWWDWLIVVLFPFYSSLIFGNAYSFPLLFLFFLIGVFAKWWKFSFKGLLPFVLLGILTLLVEYRMLYLLFSGVETNRMADTHSTEKYMNIKGIIGSSVLGFVFNQRHYHALSLPIAIVSLFYTGYYCIKGELRRVLLPLVLMFFIFMFVFLSVFSDNVDFKEEFGLNLPNINIRFWVWLPFLWYLTFAYTLRELLIDKKRKIISVLVSFQIIYVLFLVYPRDYFGARYADNVFANTYLYSNNQEQVRWEEYYMTSEFEKIKAAIPDITDYKTVRIDILPEILQYNGLKTIEAFYVFYPIERLQIIRQIDSVERAESELSKRGYYRFSNRNFLFYDQADNGKPKWNWDLLRKENVKYLISYREINDFSGADLVYSNSLKVYRIDRVE